MKAPISCEDFEALDMRVGTIKTAVKHPTAKKPAYILEVDFGTKIGILKSSAQLTNHYQTTQLVGTQVIGLLNFPPKQIGTMTSQCLIMGIYDATNEVVLLKPDQSVPNGSKIG